MALLASGGALAATSAPALAAAGITALATAGGPTAGLLDPGTVCTATAPGAVSCDLWAKEGSLALPGAAAVPVWSFTDTAAGAVGGVGPNLVVTAGDTVSLTLHNDLTVGGAASLSLPQVEGFREDTTGVASTLSTTYTFTVAADRPGTYLYQAGPTPNGSRQAAMGMVGALVVRPAGGTGTAYGAAASAFDDEAVLVLTEIDLAFAAAPLTYDLRQWTPRYRLLNGRVHPAAPHIATAAGNRVLLRYVNGGLGEHSLGLLGARQVEVGHSSRALVFPQDVATDSVTPGDTLDTIVTVPSSGTLFPVLETAAHLDNAGLLDPGTGSQKVTFGGMLTMLDTGPVSTLDTLGPVSSVTITPARSGTATVAPSFTATVSDVSTGGSDVTTVGWSLDKPTGPFDTLTIATPGPLVTVGAPIPTAALSTGGHNVYVQAGDSAGNVGVTAATSFVYDAAAPVITTAVVSAVPTGTPLSLNVSGTASDLATGGSPIQSVEARLDGAATGVTLALATPAAASTAFSGLLPLVPTNVTGSHTVTFVATDSVGNVSLVTTVNVTVDLAGPTTVVVTQPGATNLVQGSQADPLSMEVSATITPAANGSVVTKAEGFLGAAGTPGTGFVLSPYTNGGVTRWVGYFPLSALIGKADGTYTVSARGQNAAGTWGDPSTGTFVLDRTVPLVPTAPATSNTYPGTSALLTVTGTDAGVVKTPIVYAEWFEGADPGSGRATPLAAKAGAPGVFEGSIDTSTLSAGTHTLRLRVQDQAGNWSPLGSTTFTVTLANAIFSTTFDALPLVPPWSGATGAATIVSGAMVTAIAGNTPRYVTDTRPYAEQTYHASFTMNPNGFRTSTAVPPAAVTVFQGLNAANQVAFALQYRRGATGDPQVSLQVTRAGGTSSSAWQTMTGAAVPHTLRIDWASGTATTPTLTVDGLTPVRVSPLATLNTTSRVLDTVRLGPSAGLVGGGTGSTGSPSFDNFVSTRYTLP